MGHRKSKDILCLASGGGQQAPILAAAGANVTSFDNSAKQLEQDKLVANRENLEIRIEKGDAADLSGESSDTLFFGIPRRFKWFATLDQLVPVGQSHTVVRASEKVAISLERELFVRAERLRRASGESRSALVGRALRQLLRDEGVASDVKQYVAAYSAGNLFRA